MINLLDILTAQLFSNTDVERYNIGGSGKPCKQGNVWHVLPLPQSPFDSVVESRRFDLARACCHDRQIGVRRTSRMVGLSLKGADSLYANVK